MNALRFLALATALSLAGCSRPTPTPPPARYVLTATSVGGLFVRMDTQTGRAWTWAATRDPRTWEPINEP